MLKNAKFLVLICHSQEIPTDDGFHTNFEYEFVIPLGISNQLQSEIPKEWKSCVKV